MKSSLFILVALIIFLGFPNLTRAASCHPDDMAALLAFKSGMTEDLLGILSAWKKGTDCCMWFEIVCNVHERVRAIMIIPPASTPGYTLAGTLSPSLAKLQHLEGIYLPNLKNITGLFPHFLFRLPKIKYVYLPGNRFFGPLPVNIGNLKKLEQLSIEENRFTGPFPSSISNLTRLLLLNISENQISGSPVKFLNQAKKLGIFAASGNKLRFDMGKLKLQKTLARLDLSRNLIYGKIPRVANLLSLNVSQNHLCGKLPTTMFSASVFAGNDCLCGSPLPPCKI